MRYEGNPFRVYCNSIFGKAEIDESEVEQCIDLTYGDYDIKLRVYFTVTKEDIGIGSYEFWGISGFDSQIARYLDEINSVELLIITNQEEIDNYYKKRNLMSEEERNITFKNGDRPPCVKLRYREIKLNQKKLELLSREITEAI